MFRWCVILSLLMSGVHSRASATDFPTDSGNSFYGRCSSAKSASGEYVDFGVCIGFIQGIITRDAYLPAPWRLICVPEGATYGQNLDVVLKYLGNNPERRQNSAGYLVTSALNNAFPCKGTDK